VSVSSSVFFPLIVESKADGFNVYNDETDLVKNSDTVLVAVKPVHAKALFEKIGEKLKKKLIISVVAGLESGTIKSWIGSDKRAIEPIPDILFTKETNNEQIEIIKSLYSHRAVVVQGPPGTGKTHTIANLLGHFLAEGKNVLITSQTKKALDVLKEKIPTDIQDLCISMLDDDSSDLGNSVETISEKLASFSNHSKTNNNSDFSSEREIMYKILFDMRNDINDLKSLTSELIKNRGTGEFSMHEQNLINRIYTPDVSSANPSSLLYFETPPAEIQNPTIITRSDMENYNNIEDIELEEAQPESLSLQKD